MPAQANALLGAGKTVSTAERVGNVAAGAWNQLCEIVAPADAKTAYIAVQGYAASSQYKIVTTVIDLAPVASAYNPAAVSLRQVQTELRWIDESVSNIDGNLSAAIDPYTQKDIYDYVTRGQ